MTTAVERGQPRNAVNGWRLHGRATIDDRQPVRCSLFIGADGNWSADVSTFTLAGTVDLYFVTGAGGNFCGPAFVERSRADTEPLRATTALTGIGPLLVVAAETAKRELPEFPNESTFDGEVVG